MYVCFNLAPLGVEQPLSVLDRAVGMVSAPALSLLVQALVHPEFLDDLDGFWDCSEILDFEGFWDALGELVDAGFVLQLETPEAVQ